MKILLDYSESYSETYEYSKVGSKKSYTISDYKKPIEAEKFYSEKSTCPFCKIKIPIVFNDYSNAYVGVELRQEIRVWECPQCNWWSSMVEFSENRLPINHKLSNNWDTVNLAILKKYDASSNDLPIETLIKELNKNSQVLYSIHPYKLEELAQSVFSSYYNCEVQHVGKSGDGGIDLLIVESDDPILVQVKRREKQKHVELVSQVREFVGAMYLNDSKKGIYLSTAMRFSKGSHKIKKNVLENRKFEYFELIDFNRFLSMTEVLKKDQRKSWEKIVDGYKLGK